MQHANCRSGRGNSEAYHNTLVKLVKNIWRAPRTYQTYQFCQQLFGKQGYDKAPAWVGPEVQEGEKLSAMVR